MEFRKKIDIPRSPLDIGYQTKLILFGSCFAENIGKNFVDNKFPVNLNPFGVLYNPASISQAIRLLLDEKVFTETDIFKHEGVYRSFLHHSEFCETDKQRFLDVINSGRKKTSSDIRTADILLITFGTSYVYRLKESGNIVANCHKVPASEFDHFRLSVSDIVRDWKSLIDRLQVVNPDLKILFTVSPIRHWKDGAHNNQLSKSVLLLAIDELQQMYPSVFYFPSYEIVLDELRDYRFYADDMIHPNDMAIRYIWSIFADTFFDDTTKQIIKQWQSLHKAIEHRPFNEDTPEHQQFLKQTLSKLYSFREKHPGFDCQNEIESLEYKIR
ncbi:GSCFA domain-containing protein [Dysgonomonas macrotermitis]|uniref:GSCFA family protein n=1 Tax=Dysgonomonas macrotermitis TaxID=1346286 RepID=A0A1M5IEU3_9BACT|nr:GSCFA domain-containing protein [Dysgonomonas macrotermitis]SHG26786.1 GSCFA family protein [Dysgonomonas macrotermitis]